MLEIGIDIGGTFTDVVCLVDSGDLFTVKTPSTPDVVGGVIAGVDAVLERAGRDRGEAAVHVHGTTVATNAILEGAGAVTALLTTAGHEDALEIGRQKRSRMYDLFLDPETPGFLAPRRRRIGITERVGGDGEVVTPLDEAQLADAVDDLVERHGVESIAICYLNSYLNPAHEQRSREIVAERYSGLAVSISAEVNPVFREYERTCATVFDAYVRPIVERYLRQLGKELGEADGALRLMQSRGAITSASLAAKQPVTMVLSGPAAGVVGARFAAAATGRGNLITMDTGGTSTDVSLVRDGAIELTKDGKLKGYPLRLPMVDINAVGSGGGSIAWLDEGGGLHVGPQSAGAVPGPACYGRGGTEPTATDASVVLGYINPDFFVGGGFRLDADAARWAVAGLAEKLGLDTAAAALGIHRILNVQMAEAIKLVTVKRGYDPRRFSLVAFGGAGAIHAAAVARQLEIGEVVVPRNPGTLSAFGLIVSDVEYDNVVAFHGHADAADADAMESIYRQLEDEGRARLSEEGLPDIPIEALRAADMRYVGQSYELEIPVGAEVNAESLAAAGAAFHQRHEEVFGHADATRPVEFVNLRTVCRQQLPKPDFADVAAGASGAATPIAHRLCHFEAGAFETPIYRESEIGAGKELAGPCIVEAPDTTVVVHPGQTLTRDARGNLIVRVSGSA